MKCVRVCRYVYLYIFQCSIYSLKAIFFLVRLEVHYLLAQCFYLFGSPESFLVQRIILSFFCSRQSKFALLCPWQWKLKNDFVLTNKNEQTKIPAATEKDKASFNSTFFKMRNIIVLLPLYQNLYPDDLHKI